MKNLLLPALLALLFAAAPAWAQDPPAQQKEITLKKIVEVHNLRCGALIKGKQATTSGNIERSQRGHLIGGLQLLAEQKIKNYEAEASASFEQAGKLKRRAKRMTDDYLKERRAAWYATVDIARRIHIERQILGAREILAEPCN